MIRDSGHLSPIHAGQRFIPSLQFALDCICTVQGWAAQKTTNLRQNKLRKMLPTAWITRVSEETFM